MTKKKASNYSLSDEVIHLLIDPMFTKTLKNRENIKQMLLETFSSNNLELLIELIHSNVKYIPFYQNCYVSVLPQTWWKGDLYENDRLRDMGLLSDEGHVYGQIMNDTHWNDETFNPYYHKFKVNLFLHEVGKAKLYVKEEEIEGEKLTLLTSADCINYFKVKNKL